MSKGGKQLLLPCGSLLINRQLKLAEFTHLSSNHQTEKYASKSKMQSS